MNLNNINSNTNVFSPFPKYDCRVKNSVVVDSRVIDNDKKDSVNIDAEKSQRKKRIIFGSTLASSIATAGILGMILTKGLHGASFIKLQKFVQKQNEKIQRTSQQKTKGVVDYIVFYSRKGAQKVLSGLQAISNFTALKDWGSNKLFHTNKVTSKFADKSTSSFKKIVDKTLGKKYDKVSLNVQDMTSLLKNFSVGNLSNLDEAQLMQKITIKNETYTLGEWLQKLSTHASNLQHNYESSFSLGARKIRDGKRFSLIGDVANAVKERFFKNKKSLFQIRNYKGYVTETVTAPAQKEMQREISVARAKVTNNISMIHDDMCSSLRAITQNVKPADNVTGNAVKKLNNLFETFRTCSGPDEANIRHKVSDEIVTVVSDLISSIGINPKYSKKEQQELVKMLRNIKMTVESATKSGSKGSLEEIMTILKGLNSSTGAGSKIVTDLDFKELSKLASKISTGLKTATDLEAGEYFMKQAELVVGSAPTDVLSVLIPVGASAYAIGSADTKDEKISNALTTCIPLVGTFATFVYGTTKMFSAPKNLVFSAVTGFAISKLGNYCDKLYKKYRDTGSIVNVVKDELTDVPIITKDSQRNKVKKQDSKK